MKRWPCAQVLAQKRVPGPGADPEVVAAFGLDDLERASVDGGEQVGAEHLLGGALRGDGAFVEHHDVGDGGGEFLKVVGDEDHRRPLAPVLEQRLDRCEHLFSGEEVESRGGLVEQEQAGLADHRPGDQAADALAAAEVLVGGFEDRPEADSREQPFGLGAEVVGDLAVEPDRSELRR